MSWRKSPPCLWALTAILVLYGMMGLAYARWTPLWESPDEPAHYNYVRYLLEHRQFPVLQSSDYDFDYLERIKAARFPEEMSIDPIRYEYHQPPLYYLVGAVLAAPLPETWQPLALRFFSVVLGMASLFVTFRVGIEIFPRQPLWALGATAFAATVPMHVAMTAAINNDTLAELLLALVLLTLVRRVAQGAAASRVRNDLLLGLLLGLGLVTKTTTYIAIPLAAIVILGPAMTRRWQPETGPNGGASPWRSALASLARVLGVALLVGLPWFARNSAVYGGLDILGLIRHNAIMLEQPHTADWLAHLGWAGLAKVFVLTTFRSFWAQFGWMGVLVDERIYLALALFCALAGLGVVLFLLRDLRKLDIRQRWRLGLLALSFLFTFTAYLWYNIQFVQHQGRYLFPALIPIAIFAALGIWTLLDRAYAGYLALLLVAGTAGAGLWGWWAGQANKWLMAFLGGAAVSFGLRMFLPSTWRAGLYALVFLGLWVLDAICLFAFIVPYFAA